MRMIGCRLSGRVTGLAGVLAAVAGWLAMVLPADGADVVQLKIGSLAPERSAWGRSLKNAAQEVNQTLGGRVTVTVYPGGVQGDEPTVVRKMRIGQLHGGAFLGRGLSLSCPDSLVLQLPLLFSSNAEVDYVLPQVVPYLEAEGRENGYEILAWTVQGFNYVFSKEPVKDLAGLRRAKTWLLEDDLFLKTLFRVAEVPAIPAQVADVLPGLQSGLLHTVYSPAAGLIALQWHTRVRYRLAFGLSHSFGAVVMARKPWAALAPADQEQVRGIFRKHIAELNAGIRQQNDEALAVLEKNVTTLDLDPAALDEFRAVNNKAKQELVDRAFSAEALRRTESYLVEFRKAPAAAP